MFQEKTKIITQKCVDNEVEGVRDLDVDQKKPEVRLREKYCRIRQLIK